VVTVNEATSSAFNVAAIDTTEPESSISARSSDGAPQAASPSAARAAHNVRSFLMSFSPIVKAHPSRDGRARIALPPQLPALVGTPPIDAMTEQSA
jgi:hypothetical protein